MFYKVVIGPDGLPYPLPLSRGEEAAVLPYFRKRAEIRRNEMEKIVKGLVKEVDARVVVNSTLTWSETGIEVSLVLDGVKLNKGWRLPFMWSDLQEAKKNGRKREALKGLIRALITSLSA